MVVVDAGPLGASLHTKTRLFRAVSFDFVNPRELDHVSPSRFLRRRYVGPRFVVVVVEYFFSFRTVVTPAFSVQAHRMIMVDRIVRAGGLLGEFGGPGARTAHGGQAKL